MESENPATASAVPLNYEAGMAGTNNPWRTVVHLVAIWAIIVGGAEAVTIATWTTYELQSEVHSLWVSAPTLRDLTRLTVYGLGLACGSALLGAGLCTFLQAKVAWTLLLAALILIGIRLFASVSLYWVIDCADGRFANLTAWNITAIVVSSLGSVLSDLATLVLIAALITRPGAKRVLRRVPT